MNNQLKKLINLHNLLLAEQLGKNSLLGSISDERNFLMKEFFRYKCTPKQIVGKSGTFIEQLFAFFYFDWLI